MSFGAFYQSLSFKDHNVYIVCCFILFVVWSHSIRSSCMCLSIWQQHRCDTVLFSVHSCHVSSCGICHSCSCSLDVLMCCCSLPLNVMVVDIFLVCLLWMALAWSLRRSESQFCCCWLIDLLGILKAHFVPELYGACEHSTVCLRFI